MQEPIEHFRVWFWNACIIYDIINILQTDTDVNVHITPLPRSLSFYDVNEDNQISLNEFARTLGHSPRDLHVKVAFRAADKNGKQLTLHRLKWLHIRCLLRQQNDKEMYKKEKKIYQIAFNFKYFLFLFCLKMVLRSTFTQTIEW